MSFLVPTLASFLLPVLALGPVPRHIAFIMDGNRRWASSHRTDVRAGHASGFEALKRVLESCLALRGLECITVYAFAIDNFKRSQDEVDALMELASSRLLELASHGQVIARHCVRIRIIGRTELLPAHVQAAVRKVEAITKDNDKALLNICIPYAARDEMAAAVRLTLREQLHARLDDLSNPYPSSSSSSHSDDDDDEALDPTLADQLAHNLMFTHAPPLDLLVRTSGVRRLSDFMLAQATATDEGGGGAQLAFVDCFWPQFGLRHLVPLLLDYQRGVWAARRQGAGRVGASRRVGMGGSASASASGRGERPEGWLPWGRGRGRESTWVAGAGKRGQERIRHSARSASPVILLLFLASLLLLLARVVYDVGR